jgi:hypothetical protein
VTVRHGRTGGKALIFVCRRVFFGIDRRFGPEMEIFSGLFCFYEAGENGVRRVIFAVSEPMAFNHPDLFERGKKMAMSKPEPISVLFVAAVSAALHGSAAVLFVPILSFLFLSWGAGPAPFRSSMGLDDGMIFAVIAPAICTAFGFFAGALVALAHNLFAQSQRKLTVEASEPLQVREAALRSVA